MQKALVLTAYNRLNYLTQVMEYWDGVRGRFEWNLFVHLEPSDVLNKMCDIIGQHAPEAYISVNERVLGVLENPYQAFEKAFRTHEFVLRLEDDVVVSQDALEYVSWAAEEYRYDPEIALVQMHSMRGHGAEGAVVRTTDFSPWNWGTWYPEWLNFIGPTWDHDYSTHNGTPGVEAGWDWNLNTRVLPSLNKKIIAPVQSRSEHIGVYGTHGTPDTIHYAPLFRGTRGQHDYFEEKE